MPSSFKGTHGMIAYILTAKMSRSWWIPCQAKQELKFVSNSTPTTSTVIRPKSLSVEKEIGIFTKGKVRLAVTIDRNVCTPGETVVAVAKVTNSSSRTMRPRVCLIQREIYRAMGKTRIMKDGVCNTVGEPITPQTEETVCCPLKTPHEMAWPIHNCGILSVDYFLKVYLDIRFHLNPQVAFPLVIVPAHVMNSAPGGVVGPDTAQAQSKSDFPPPLASAEPHPEHSGCSAYGDPTLDQLPQQMTPYGPSSTDFPSSSASEHWQSPAALPFYTIF
ncbi:arrestin domain-containing protein 3-like [Genypterus blacodes]|uniref:arrestin domain-containing protein 3-like n=1 Tax=Genypterus blacodes TaxID=154954 RepID=UPI003F75FFFD